MVEQLRTVWNGICLKIKFDFFSLDLKPTFNLAFSTSLSLDDVPMPEIYLTSEDNAYGIINYGWANGEELKIDLEGVEQVLSWAMKMYLKKISEFKYFSRVSNYMHLIEKKSTILQHVVNFLQHLVKRINLQKLILAMLQIHV